MKKLLQRIRKILHDRRTRQLLTRAVSISAALIVFVTTYALVLPAITMEMEAQCGIEAHQHDDSCYEEMLVCGLEESPGHAHSDACYSVSPVLTCMETEHTHSVEEGCFDDEGNLICEKAEHTHTDDCYGEERTLTCGLEESEGHHHTDACYERVLTCEKEVHVHSAACYRTDSAKDPAAVESTSSASAAPAASTGEAVSTTDSTVSTAGITGAASPAVDTVDSKEDRDEGPDLGFENIGNDGTETAAAALTVADSSAGYIPRLDPLDFSTVLNDHTGIYYHRPADGEVIEDSTLIPADGWTRIPSANEKNTSEHGDNGALRRNDLLRVYLAYTIPAGALNSSNPAARYRLPGNIHLTDAQVRTINENVNGIAGQYVDLSTLEILDTEKYESCCGIEAVEGDRQPDQPAEDYFRDHKEMNGSEYISATVKVENIRSADGDYEGQDLVFTFTPYSIQKNQHEYDSDGRPTVAGKGISGWLTLDFNMGQVDWNESAADIVFVKEGLDRNDHKIKEISTTLKLAGDTEAKKQGSLVDDRKNRSEDQEPADQQEPADKTGSDSKDGKDAIMPAMSFNDSITVSTGRPKDLDENAGGIVANAADLLPKKAKVTVRVEADEGTFPAGTTMVLKAVDDIDAVAEAVTETVESPAAESDFADDPADVTEAADKEEGSSGKGDGKEQPDQPEKKKEKQKETEKNETQDKTNLKTYGFQAVDITFVDTKGKDIEPAKPVRVALTSAAVEKVKEEAKTSAVTDPVVIHVDDDGNAEQMELVAPEEIEPAKGKTEEELLEEKQSGSDEPKAPKDEDADSAGADTAGEAEVEKDAAEGETEKPGEADTDSTVGFRTDSFSVYAIVYTVDFHYDVDGQTYDFSIRGGDTIGLRELLPILNVMNDDDSTEVNEVQTFINDIENVGFSDESLIKVIQITEDTTAGELKEKIKEETGEEPEYSGDLGEEELAGMDAKKLKAADWALVSMKAFESEETLTVTMKSGEVFSIKVTDENTPAPDAAGNPPNAFYGEDTTKYATKINLFDYGPTNNSTNSSQNLDCVNNNLQNNPNSNVGINQNHALKFFSYGKKPSDVNQTSMGINHFSGGPYAVQGIVNNTLDGLYPKLNGGASLDYLFNDWESGTTKQVYSNVTNLFQRDSNGKFFYDSNANYAYYNPGQGDNGKVVLGSTFTEEGSDWGVGFFPFDGYNDYYNCIHGDGINWCENRNTNKVGHYNHHFGMSMQVDFMMSSDHRMSGQDMMFNFRGDDDMWVFVDDVLILDIGGVHNPVGGWIDFTHQTVHVDSAIQVGGTESSYQAVNKTFAQIFADAGRTWDNSPYAEHTLKVFYLERGGCYSNLQVEYNLTRYIDYEFYKKDQYGEAVPGAKFSLYKEDGTRLIKEVQTDNNGNITGTTYFEATSGPDGRVYFDHVPLGKYEIREIETPTGYVKSGATYKAILEVREKENAPGQYDAVTYLEKTAAGVTTRVEPKEILNFKDVEVVLNKAWNDKDNTNPPAGAKATFTLMRNQKILPKEVTVVFQYSDGTEIGRESGLYDGDTIVIKDYELSTSAPTGNSSSAWDRTTRSAEGTITIIENHGVLPISTETIYSPTGWTDFLGGWHHTGWGKDTVTSQEVRYIVNSDHADQNNLIVLKLNKTSAQFVTPPGMFVERGEHSHNDERENVPVLSFTLPDEADDGEQWKKTLENLPAADPYGNRYKYYIVEDEITGIDGADRFIHKYTTTEGTEANPLEEGGEIGIINIETVTARVVKAWDHTGNDGTRPASLTVTLSNGDTRELNADNNWTAEVSGLPKYDEVTGNLIEYSWTEEELPGGYYLSSIQNSSSEATGVITSTLTNAFTKNYNPLTKIIGKKEWDDDGGLYRPASIIVKLYKDGGTTPYREITVQAPVSPGADQDVWPFEFTNLPIFNEDGSLVQYTVEEVLPSGYTNNYTITQNFSTATYVAGTATGHIVNSGQGSQTLELCDGTDLGYVVIRHGNDFIIWTPRPVTSDEISSIKAKVIELSEQFNGISTASGNSLKIISGVPQTVDVGKKHAVSVYMNGSKVMLKFLDPSAWSDFAYGTIPYTYTQAGGEGGGTIKNTMKTVSVDAAKAWINTAGASMTPANGTTVTFDVYIGGTALNRPIVLNGKVDVAELDPDPAVAQTQEVNAEALAAKAYESAAWTALWTNLPERDASGNLIQYTVKETVCPNGFENQTTAGVNTGGTITNKQTTIDISLNKTDESGEGLKGAKFQLWVDTAVPPASSNYVLVKTAAGYASGYESIRFNDGTAGAADAELTTVYANEKTPGTGTAYESGFVTSDQTMTLKNLPDGKYKLVEVDAPAGFIILENEILFEITNGAVSAGTSDKVHLDPEASPAVLTVENTSGAELPSTGGPGTKLIFLLGGLMTGFSLLLLVGRKRIRK